MLTRPRPCRLLLKAFELAGDFFSSLYTTPLNQAENLWSGMKPLCHMQAKMMDALDSWQCNLTQAHLWKVIFGVRHPASPLFVCREG